MVEALIAKKTPRYGEFLLGEGIDITLKYCYKTQAPFTERMLLMATPLNERLFFEEGEYPITVTPLWDKDTIICPEHLRVKNVGDAPYEIIVKLFGLRTSMTTKEVIEAMRELGVMPLFHFELAELLIHHRYLAKGRDVVALGNHFRENRYPYSTSIMEGRMRKRVVEHSPCYCPLPNAQDWHNVRLWDVKSHLRFAVTKSFPVSVSNHTEARC